MPAGVYVFSPRCQEAVRLLGKFLFISGKRFRCRATVDRTLASLSPPKWTWNYIAVKEAFHFKTDIYRSILLLAQPASVFLFQ